MSFIWMFDTFIGQLAINFRRIFIVFARFFLLSSYFLYACVFSSLSSLLSSCLFRFFFLFNSLLHFDFISAHTIRTYDNNINSVTFLCVRSTHLFDFNRSITLCRFFPNSCRFFRFSYANVRFSSRFLLPFYFWSFFLFCLSVSHYICRWCLIKSGISVFFSYLL